MGIIIEQEFNHIKEEVTGVIKDVIREEGIDTVSESSIDNLAIHLALSITRLLSGNYIDTSQSQLESCKDLETYSAAKKIIDRLSERYDISDNDGECDVYYAAMYLAGINLLDLDFDSMFDIVDDEIEEVMNETLDAIYNRLGYDLRQNKDFYKGITLHFYPAIERLQNDHQLENNPLADLLAAQNEKEYQCAVIMNEIVNNHFHKKFNDNEIGYITLHFGTAFYTA